MNNHLQLIEIADSYLNLLLSNNDYHSLELCCPLDNLSRSKWQVEDSVQTEFHSIPITVLKMQFMKECTVVATYTIYLNKDLDFLDEFFTS